ncbi:unnamed protein product [Adineta ricciae]|uniref:Uncharacterized protein n=1 Tax=Adineta ricciae TaxID=249248 RepID=A0A814RXR4_ADIRI|nr:unnamed protein product [Adineta ricciae]
MLIGNCAGVLSPLDDPPLYMGYTNSVKFAFTFQHLYKIFLVANGYIIIVFGLIDLFNTWTYRKAKRIPKAQQYKLTSCEEKYDLSST